MKRRANRIVREYLERVSWELLERHRSVVGKMIRGHAGVYALYILIRSACGGGEARCL